MVLAVEEEKCQLLHTLGLNVNLGPVCDITTDPNAFLYDRSLGQDVMTTADVIFCIVWKMSSQNMGSVLKHFPGYGNNADTHTDIITDSRTLEELETALLGADLVIGGVSSFGVEWFAEKILLHLGFFGQTRTARRKASNTNTTLTNFKSTAKS